MAKEKAFSDPLNWFYTHCASYHEEICTQMGMIDVAMWAMWQVKHHFIIDEVTPKAKSKFAETLCSEKTKHPTIKLQEHVRCRGGGKENGRQNGG